MTVGDDFDEYAAARWPTLVRALLLLGAPEQLAVEVATDVLSRLQREWRRLRADGDPDGEVWSLVSVCWDARRRRRWWLDHPSTPTPVDYRHLDALAPPERAQAVRLLLDESHVPVDGADLRGLVVTTPPPERRGLVDARRRRRRDTVRRARLPVAVGVVLVALVLGAAAVMSSLGSPRRPDALDPDRLPRSLASVAVTAGPDSWVVWYAEGELHLGTAALAVRDVRSIVAVPGGAVYVDQAGQVVSIDPSGHRVLLGHTDAAPSLVAAPDGGLVGWLDTTDPARPALTVAHGLAGAGRRSYELPSRQGVAVVGLRDDRLYAVRGDQSLSWRFATGVVVLTEPDLRLVVGQLAVFGPADPDTSTLRVTFLDPDDTTPPPTTWVQLDGETAELAPDGSAVLTRTGAGAVQLTGLNPRTALPTGLMPREVVTDAVVGPDLQVAYLVAVTSDLPKAGDFLRGSASGTIRLRTCTVSVARRATECRTVVELSTAGEVPVLAR